MTLFKNEWVVDSDTKTATHKKTKEVIDWSESLENLPFLVAQMIREWKSYF